MYLDSYGETHLRHLSFGLDNAIQRRIRRSFKNPFDVVNVYYQRMSPPLPSLEGQELDFMDISNSRVEIENPGLSTGTIRIP